MACVKIKLTASQRWDVFETQSSYLLQLDVCCLSRCGGAIRWTLTRERQAWCYLQVKLY